MNPIRTTRALIHRENVKFNLGLIREALPAGTLICAAVKAQAYGHGSVETSQLLREEGVEVLGVSNPFEAVQLREAGDTGRILLLGPTVPEEAMVTVGASLEPVVADNDYLDSLEKAAVALNIKTPIEVHLKVDTGMHRIGCRPEDTLDFARRINASEHLELAGLATHFPSADSELEVDLTFTRQQTRLLGELADKLESAGISPKCLHAANSGAVALSRFAAFNMVRVGLAIYGYGPSPDARQSLKPVMELRTRVTAIRYINKDETVSYGRTWTAPEACWIATLPVGYADGYQRILSNQSEVLIGRRRYPLVGRVCMDQIMVNLGARTDVKLYDEAVLFGPKTGEAIDPPDASELADLAGTIPYEITCGISGRVPRIYLD